MPVNQQSEDADYWLRLEKYLPWKLYGFSYKRWASFTTPINETHSGVVDLTAKQFEQLIEAFECLSNK